MKKLLLSLLMLCSMTAAWAGEGDGSKEHPFSGEWDVHDLGPKIKKGSYIAYNCQIDWVYMIVTDSRLNAKLPAGSGVWSPSDVIGESPLPIYEQYCKDNPIENRKKQSFIVTEVTKSSSSYLDISGYFSGFYSTPDATDGFVYVATTEQMWKAIKANARAKVRLTADFALSDINTDGETYCETFYGTIDGDGHTIKGDPVANVRARTYMFYWSDGATFKNLTFKGIRVNSDDPNQAIITAKAKNGCAFENITFDNVHTWSNDDNAAAAAGWAQDCTFTNITVKNSDFTTDDDQAGCVVGHAIRCNFENIKVDNCKSTSAAGVGSAGKSGGVAGRTDNCTINNVEILGSFIKTNGCYSGGVVGYAEDSHFTNCVVDDQSCLCVDGSMLAIPGRPIGAHAGGIVGRAVTCEIYNCVNSSLVVGDLSRVGGIVGFSEGSSIVGCLNTGMVIPIDIDDVEESLYNQYKTKTGISCVTKSYQGKEYVIRRYEGRPGASNEFGGIAGYIHDSNVSKCVNFGSVYGGQATAGIVGKLEQGTITDCLSDCSGGSWTSGICYFDESNYSAKNTVKNCLNLTSYRDFEANLNEWENFSAQNCYSLTTEGSSSSTFAKYITKTTAAQIKSGVICLRLGSNWEQHLDIDQYPTPTGGNKGLYYTREVSNEYGTICLPFALESNEDITYYRFNPDVKNEDGSVVLEFRKIDSVEAGEPVLFRTSKTGELTFRNTGSSYSDMPHNTIMVDVPWGIVGVYEQQVFTESTSPSSDHVYYVSDGKIKNAKKVTIAPYRAWLGGPNIETLNGSNGAPAKAIRFVIEDEDGETTALDFAGNDLVPMQNADCRMQNVYNLAGQKVDENYRGIVIKNGKRYLKK